MYRDKSRTLIKLGIEMRMAAPVESRAALKTSSQQKRRWRSAGGVQELLLDGNHGLIPIGMAMGRVGDE
ncbi:unnamed protein product [Linum trigynum]|uniref:Uncharacterized protein n=1 Tax=Linum trigynum TaxID=586398 RepID=A0AAV2E4U1_9ROSI